MLEHLDLNALIAAYGYWVIFIGCLLEGETVLILGGMAAHQGSLQWPQVIGWATLGGILGDQLLFWTGRYGGARLLPKLKRHQAAIERVQGLIQRYPSTSVFAVRFLYGMRLVGPMVIGASGLAPWRFALLNVLGAAVWGHLVRQRRLLGRRSLAAFSWRPETLSPADLPRGDSAGGPCGTGAAFA